MKTLALGAQPRTMNTKNSKISENNRLVSTIRSVILGWDPYGLIAGGEPLNEFDGEISRIAARTAAIRRPADAIRIISEVFSRSFEPVVFKPQLCKKAGKRLFSSLRGAGLIVKSSASKRTAAPISENLSTMPDSHVNLKDIPELDASFFKKAELRLPKGQRATSKQKRKTRKGTPATNE